MMYGFNTYTLQLNLLTDALKDRLPPTDSRFRPDLRLWEEGKVDEASAEKSRLEDNQRKRKKELSTTLSDMDLDNDPSYYTPKYFCKSTNPITGDLVYDYSESNQYQSSYWDDRDKNNFKHQPKIFEDECEAFFK